ncbi:hypothetical protein, partial [Mesorhizobium sp.]|uniref:hypothetical protein n=1 Tax=Mesorhizobium sp. TaxID=1871066 RepID=UPI0025BE9AD2
HCKSLQLANRSESQNITKRDFCSSLLKHVSRKWAWFRDEDMLKIKNLKQGRVNPFSRDLL